MKRRTVNPKVRGSNPKAQILLSSLHSSVLHHYLYTGKEPRKLSSIRNESFMKILYPNQCKKNESKTRKFLEMFPRDLTEGQIKSCPISFHVLKVFSSNFPVK